MRMFETTATVTQNESNIPRRYAHYLQSMKMMRMMAVTIAVIGMILGVASLRYSVPAAVVCIVLFGAAAAICIPVGSRMAKQVAANIYEDGDGVWMMTTWFESDGIHREDEDGDVLSYPLDKLVCCHRAGDVLILCTGVQAVLPVNLTQLSETDRGSVCERIEAGCPQMKMIRLQ